jgi:hypothetical protein
MTTPFSNIGETMVEIPGIRDAERLQGFPSGWGRYRQNGNSSFQ